MGRRGHYQVAEPETAYDDSAGMTPCARDNRCEERDYQGNAQLCPRAFCETDHDYIARAVSGLPRTYVELHGLLARIEQARERVSGSREAPIPLATDIQAFMREIVHVTVSWEERVRDVRGLSDYAEYARKVHGLGDDEEVRRRDSVALDGACRTLSLCLETLLSLEPWDYLRPATRKRVGEVIEERGDERPAVLNAYGHWMFAQPLTWDTAGDTWETVTLDGTAAGLEFLAVNGRARGMLGYSRQRRRITEIRCDNRKCNAYTLVQYEGRDGGWEPKVSCTACPNAYIGAAFELLMGRIYQAQLEKLGKAS